MGAPRHRPPGLGSSTACHQWPDLGILTLFLCILGFLIYIYNQNYHLQTLSGVQNIFNRLPRIGSRQPPPPGIILTFQLKRLLANKECCHPACPQCGLHSICGGHVPFPSSKKDQRAGLGWWGAGRMRGRHSIKISPLLLLGDRRSGNVGTNG